MSNKKCTRCNSLLDVFASVCPECGGTTFDHNLSEVIKSTDLPTSKKPSKNREIIKEPTYPISPPPDLKNISQDNFDLESLIKKQEETIRAINRTTHAVRAFVLFLFYQLFAITISGVIYFIAIAVGDSNEACQDSLAGCSPNAFLILLSLTVWVAGVVYSSQKGWEEIEKSEIK